ncbi:S-layer homology domain-containing protein [uncultured Pseudoflavonifractor sp.]|uniref:S-layer homology domain-containing protein n=1 Tax=uncultured Pseudoflavonifractor sp. TaxID=1221379 RepID=UPI0025F2DD11|nr:S-layer homology domain-containing protein [uncultured Pseudoflavonifractor sp.]
MRNLKRVLSLALASVMLLGMMVIGAGAADKTAADLTDIDKVTNKDAVNLMVDLGIIEGKPDGSFAPTEGVDRATMAKLITYILMGDVDQTAFEGTATDLKDIDTSWAEGYIKYCYSNGIITGDGQGHFFPTQGVTVVQAAKMLLVALGYDADAQEYQGNPNWSTNIMKDAQKAGLTNDLGLKATDTLTRDNAAQMIFNALFANTVTNTYGYDLNGNKYVSGSTANKTTLGEETYNLQKVTGIVTGISANGKAIVDNVATDLVAAPDQVGVQVIYYKNSKTGDLISSTLSTGKSSILGTSTDGTALADLSNPDKAAYRASKDTKVDYYYNGSKSNESSVSTAAAKAGVIIDLIDNDNNGKYDVVRATEKTVATVGEKGVTVSKATSASKVDSVTIDGVVEITNVAVDRVKGYADLAANDVILYVKVGNTYYIEKAAAVTGTITGTKKVSSSVTGYLLGGDTYTASGLVSNPFADFNNKFNTGLTLYLDDNGSVVKVVFDTEADSNDYAVVLETAWVTTQGVGAKGYGEALLLMTDGTTQVVRVSKVGNAPAADGNSDKKIDNVNEGQFYTYKTDANGNYVLGTNAKYENKVITSATITSGKAEFVTGVVGNNATVFLVKTTTDGQASYAVYTGIANVPGTASAKENNGYALVNKATGIASFVYISDGENTTKGTTQSTVYFLNKDNYTYTPESASGKGDDYYTYDAIVDGKVGTVKVASGAQSSIVNGLMAVTYDKSTGYVAVASSSVSNKISGNSNGKASAGAIKVGDKFYTYTDNCEVYLINAATKAVNVTTMDSVTANATANIVGVVKGSSGASATTLKALYIEYTPASGGTSGETATGFDVQNIKFTPGASKVTFTANVKANNPSASGEVATAVTAYMLAPNGEWVKMNTVPDTDTMTSGAASISTDVAGVKGTTYKFEVTVTFANETTTITSDAVMIVAE